MSDLFFWSSALICGMFRRRRSISMLRICQGDLVGSEVLGSAKGGDLRGLRWWVW